MKVFDPERYLSETHCLERDAYTTSCMAFLTGMIHDDKPYTLRVGLLACDVLDNISVTLDYLHCKLCCWQHLHPTFAWRCACYFDADLFNNSGT